MQKKTHKFSRLSTRLYRGTLTPQEALAFGYEVVYRSAGHGHVVHTRLSSTRTIPTRTVRIDLNYKGRVFVINAWK